MGVTKVNAMTPELAVNLVCPGLIIPLGTVGNCLALWTLFFSDALRKRIVSIFLICLYCADTSSLLSGYLVQWVINICGFNVTDHVDYISISYDNESSTSIQYITCRKWDPFVCLFIFHYTSFTVSAFTMSSLTIERCAVVYFPYMSITLTDHRKNIQVLMVI